MAQALRQEERREEVFYTDMHEREWSCEYDVGNGKKGSGGLCGTPLPYHWPRSAPWLPPQKYFRFDHKRRRISFDYDQMLEDYREADERWQGNKVSVAYQMHGNLSKEANDKPSTQLLTILGSNPAVREIQIIRAAMAENPWILGFTAEMPTAAAPLFVSRKERMYDPFSGAKDFDADEDEDLEAEAREESELQRLEEQLDPEATGGKVEKKGAVRKPKGKAKTKIGVTDG